MSEEHPLIGKVLDEDYKITSFLGKGGMGSVFVAEQPSLSRQVAIKILPSFDLTPEELHRFELEIASMATLIHPNIVTVHHRGKCGDPPTIYYVMELLEGGTLKNYLLRLGNLPPILVLRLIHPIAEALSFAHERGYIHRDIKPDNLLFTSNYRNIKVADFGIAKLKKERGITKSKALLGTFLYAAPEQMQWYEGEQTEIDDKADQYSLGIVLYEMISGRLPYDADTLVGMIKALSRPPVPIAEAVPHIPKSLEWLIETMIAKNPDNRFLDDDSLLDAFTTVELEIASSVSTRVFAVKSEEIIPAFPPSSGLFPSPHEKSVIQSMETQCSVYYSRWAKYWDALQKVQNHFTPCRGKFQKILANWKWDTRHNVIFSSFTLFFAALLLVLWLAGHGENLPTPDFTQEKNDEIDRIVEETHSNVATNDATNVSLRIVPYYYPPTPKGYPKLQIFFISSDGKPLQLRDTIPIGSYNLSVILPGYNCPEHGKHIEVRPGQLFHLTITLNATPRKICRKIINTDTGEEVMPVIFKIDGRPVWDNPVRPGRHHVYALFEFYREIDDSVEILPGKGDFQYRVPLLRLHQKFFRLTAGLHRPNGDYYELEAYIGKKKLYSVHLKFRRDGDNLKGHLWIPPKTQVITFRSGYYYATVPTNDISTLRSLGNIDGNRMVMHLKQIKQRKPLYRELESLLAHDKAKIAALAPKTLAKLYEFLRQRTSSYEYQDMQGPLWRMRRLVDQKEREEDGVFKDCLRKAKTFAAYEDRVTLWRSFQQKYPQGSYHKEAKKLIVYNLKVVEYKQLFKKSVQECVLSYSEKRALKKLERKLKKQDIAVIRQKIAEYLKELNCDQTLEQMLQDF